MMNAKTTADLGRCEDCDWTGSTGDLPPLTDIFERVLSGELYPAGQCPVCGSAVHCDADVADTTLEAVAAIMRRRGWLVVTPSTPAELEHATHRHDGRPLVPEYCTRSELQSALDVVGHLLNDNAEGEANGGMSWESIDATFDVARGAFPTLYEAKLIANGIGYSDEDDGPDEAEEVANEPLEA